MTVATMQHPLTSSVSRLSGVAAATAVLCFTGCASTKLDAQWSDPQFAGTSLRGTKVLVACESSDLAIKRICQDQFASELTAHGATPVMAPDHSDTTGRAVDRYLPAARDAGAKAVLSAAVAPDAFAVNPGPSVGFGIGGFSGSGGYRGGTGVGVGIAMPVGSSQRSMAYAASSTLTDVATGRPMWTAKASTPASSDVNAQLADLARAVVAAAFKAGLF